MKSGLFVVCEGVDKAGKTSVINYTLEQISEAIYNKGLSADTIMGKISRLYPSTPLFLLEQLYQDKIKVNQVIEEGKIVLQDRWFYSTICYPEKGKFAEIFSEIIGPKLRKPDLLVYFTCSLEERIRRLQSEPTPDHLDLINNPEKILQWGKNMLNHYHSFPGQKYLLDTTNRTVAESGDKLMEIIQENQEYQK